MRHTQVRPLTRPNIPLPLPGQKPCPRDVDCSCRTTKARPMQLSLSPNPTIVHANECDDPDCHEIEQLKALQTSLDHFTDYEHYERCCDGLHHVNHTEDECCVKVDEKRHGPAEPCDDYFDDCDECADEHKDCYDEVEVCDEDCEQCEVECEERGHEPEDCPHDHPTTRDNCVLPGKPDQVSLPQLGPTNDFDSHLLSNMMQDVTRCNTDCSVPTQPFQEPVQDPFSSTVFNSEIDHWQTFVQAHHCAPDPCLIGQPPQFQHPQHVDPTFGFTFGCDPSIPGNQYPWQRQTPLCNLSINSQFNLPGMSSNLQVLPTPSVSKSSASPPSSEISNAPLNVPSTLNRICEWIMPCGSICGATFTRTDDLKKHIKNSHSTKGTKSCAWQGCTASFASEAALTGHISKKHLTVSDEEGPWKCTYPGCTKSFMYKQVRDDHLASHNGGNRMHCPICHQWLNCEGSNFRRHMASHGPKNEHMRCRFESLGCKKRFPRLDNLRRHEACCKFGKRAAGVHHHHHRVHIGHES